MTSELGTSQNEFMRLFSAYTHPLKFCRDLKVDKLAWQSVLTLVIVAAVLVLPKYLSGVPLQFLIVSLGLTVVSAGLNSLLLHVMSGFLKTDGRLTNYLSFASSISIITAPLFFIPYVQKIAAPLFLIWFWVGIFLRFNPRWDRFLIVIFINMALLIPATLLVYFWAFF